MHRLTLIRHATTAAVRSSAFPVDESLDDAGRVEAAALHGLAGRGEARCGPSARARETAELLGLVAPIADPALDECDFGEWRGRTLADVHEEQPDDVAAWMLDPESAPHGGESLVAFVERVQGWMTERAEIDGSTVAVTSSGVVRAAVVAALGGSPDMTWRVDVTPLHATVLHAHDGRWTVRTVNRPLTASRPLGSSELSGGGQRGGRA